MNFQVDADALKFMLAVRDNSKHATTPWNTIRFEPDRMLATNGTHLGIVRDPYHGEPPTEPVVVQFNGRVPTTAKGRVEFNVTDGTATWFAAQQSVFIKVIENAGYPIVDSVTKDLQPFQAHHVPLALVTVASVVKFMPGFDELTVASAGAWMRQPRSELGGWSTPLFTLVIGRCEYYRSALYLIDNPMPFEHATAEQARWEVR